jgi:hypothetical protein
MFGLSLTKIIFTLAVVGLVWMSFRWVKRARTIRARESDSGGLLGSRKQSRPSAKEEATSFVACRVCGTYVAPGSAKSCGREDCPYGADPQH